MAYTHTWWNITQPLKSEIMPFAAMWMELEGIMLSEISQRKTNTVWYHLYVTPKNNTNEVKWSERHSVMSDSLWPHGLYSLWNPSSQNTGVGSFSLLQGIFPTQGLNPGLQHCRWNLYQLSHKGSPRIREWAAYPFFCGSSWPKNPTGVSCLAGGFFTSWAKREALRELTQ